MRLRHTQTQKASPPRIVQRVARTDDERGVELHEVLVALSAEQLGGAQRCLDMSVEYAKVRVQFGRPIGSFQAVKHMCADMMVLVESARSASYYAGWAVAQSPDEVAEAPRVAPRDAASAEISLRTSRQQVGALR